MSKTCTTHSQINKLHQLKIQINLSAFKIGAKITYHQQKDLNPPFRGYKYGIYNNLIIHPKWIVTGEEKNQVLEDHALVVHNGLIKDILKSDLAKQQYQANSVLQFPTHAIIPGLINSHTHLAMNYFRGLADDLALMDWLNNHIWPAERKWVSEEFVRDASLFAMAEMIRSGTTCFNDMYFFLQATAEAAKTAGIRAFIGVTVIDFPTAWAKDTETL